MRKYVACFEVLYMDPVYIFLDANNIETAVKEARDEIPCLEYDGSIILHAEIYRRVKKNTFRRAAIVGEIGEIIERGSGQYLKEVYGEFEKYEKYEIVF